MGSVHVQPVRSRRDIRDYIDLPSRIYRSDPYWIPQLRRTARHLISPRHNPFHAEARIEHFLARDEHGSPVGRIAAVVHHAYVERYGRKAFFGFFEAIPSDDVARALIEAVETWAVANGMSAVAGPYSYTGTQEVGLLVSGFDSPPALMQTHNPPYYEELLRKCGYSEAFRAACYTWRAGSKPDIESRLVDRGDEVSRALKLRVRSVRLGDYDEELENLRQVYNASFKQHPEVVAISERVFRAQAKELRSIIDPELVRIVEQDGRTIAFVMMAPNYFEVVPRSGRITPRFVLDVAVRNQHRMRRVHSATVIMMGAIPEYVGRGVGRVLAAEIVRVARSGHYPTVATTWIHEENRWCRAIVNQMRSVPTKVYAVLERGLEGEPG